ADFAWGYRRLRRKADQCCLYWTVCPADCAANLRSAAWPQERHRDPASARDRGIVGAVRFTLATDFVTTRRMAAKSPSLSVQSVVQWLVHGARNAPLSQEVLTELCERLTAAGLALWGRSGFVGTAHPENV